jgi:RNA polymerase sigma-70 factor (ECF subfamily)
MKRDAAPPSARAADDELLRLAESAAGGDPAAVRALLTAAAPFALQAIRKVLGKGHPDVEDILQEALVGVLDALSRFRGESSVAHFVRRIGLLTALNARRRHQLRRALAPEVAWDEVAATLAGGAAPSDVIDAQRRRDLFASLLDELPAPQAEALALHCVLGYTIDETARVSGVPANTVRSRLLNAKAALRKRLALNSELNDLLRGAS